MVGRNFTTSGLAALTAGVSRSISAENVTGGKGEGGKATTSNALGATASRELGRGWKVSPAYRLQPGELFEFANIQGPGVIRHIWMTVQPRLLRSLVLRVYWEGHDRPAIAVPLGDFFCQGWAEYAHVNSVPVAVNPHGGLNCYWELPFRESARMTMENLSDEVVGFFFQVSYELDEIDGDFGYLHTQWRRNNPLGTPSIHTLLDGVHSAGHYVGTYIAWSSNSSGWWGEGEVKFYLDGDQEWPTICGTGTEDYFGGAWDFEPPGRGYAEFSTAYLGLPQVIRPDGLYRSQQRFGMYRWHVPDPIRFQQDIRVTVQALGWRSGTRYLPLHDDIASTAFWYQQDPQGLPEPPLTADDLEVL